MLRSGENLFNKMYGEGSFIPTTVEKLDSEVMLGETLSLDAELLIRIIRKNRMMGSVNILKPISLYKTIDSDIEDTYVRSSLPYISFKDSTVLKSGIIEDETFFGLLKFNTLYRTLHEMHQQFINLKLVLKSVDKGEKSIALYGIDRTFKDYNVSYENKPGLADKICDMKYNEKTHEYEADLTQYAKEIIDGRRDNHNGFAFVSDTIMNVYSSESNYGKPKLVMEYYNPEVFEFTNHIPAQIDFRESKGLNVELVLEEPYPILNSEVLFSREFMDASIIFGEATHVDAEVVIAPTIGQSMNDSEFIFSKNHILAELTYGDSEGIDAEVDFIPPQNIELNAELNFGLSSARPALVNLALPGQSELDVELRCYDVGIEHLEAEMNLSLLFGSTLNSCVSLFTDEHIDAEVKVFIKDVETHVDCELEFTRTMIPVKVRFLPSVILNSELELVFSNSVDAIVKISLTSELDSEVSIVFPGESEVDACVSLYTESSMDAEVEIKLGYVLNACVSLYTNIELESEVNLVFSSNVDAEMELHKLYISSIEAECLFLDGAYLKAEMMLTKIYLEPVDAEVQVIFVEHLDALLNLALVGMSSVTAEVGFSKILNSHLDASVVYHLVGDSELNAEMTLVKKLNAKITVTQR